MIQPNSYARPVKRPAPAGAGIPGSTLKIIAIVCMLIDHIGAAVLEPLLISRGLTPSMSAEQITAFMAQGNNATLYWTDMVLRNLIGRIAFPLFAFLLIQGFCHTHNKLRYALNLAAFAVIAEVPFDLTFNGKILEFSYQNIFFTLLIGLLTIWALDLIIERHFPAMAQMLLTLLVSAAGCFLAALIRCDYYAFGVLAIVIMYMFRTRKVLCGAIGCMTLTVMSMGEVTAFLSLLPIRLYNGERGLNMKYIFYIFYPAHLLILWGIAQLII